MPKGVYKRKKPAWNKGLTKETDERVRYIAERTKEGLRKSVREGSFISWCKGLTKETDKRIRDKSEKISSSLKKYYSNPSNKDKASRACKGKPKPWLKGENNPAKRPEVREKISKLIKEYFVNPEARLNLSKKLSGKPKPWLLDDKNPAKRQDVRRKIAVANTGEKNGMYMEPSWNRGLTKDDDERIFQYSQKLKGRWSNPEFYRLMFSKFGKKPNLTEARFDKLLQLHFPREYKYVGDGNFVIGGKCPDFMNVNGQKKLIELFGRYWHRNDDSRERINHFRQYGFETLIVWDDELENECELVQKIAEFNGGDIVESAS